MDPKVKKLWVKALTSGKYRQAQTVLKNTDGEMCCLGVLCDVYRKTVKEGAWVTVPATLPHLMPTVQFKVKRASCDEYLPPAVKRWAGVNDADPHVRYGGGTTLAALNDDSMMSFKEIAEVISEHL